MHLRVTLSMGPALALAPGRGVSSREAEATVSLPPAALSSAVDPRRAQGSTALEQSSRSACATLGSGSCRLPQQQAWRTGVLTTHTACISRYPLLSTQTPWGPQWTLTRPLGRSLLLRMATHPPQPWRPEPGCPHPAPTRSHPHPGVPWSHQRPGHTWLDSEGWSGLGAACRSTHTQIHVCVHICRCPVARSTTPFPS